jgi:hypothetical protein
MMRQARVSDPTRGLVLLLFLPTIIYAGILIYGRWTESPTRLTGPTHQGALVWGDGSVLLTNRTEAAAWLRLHRGNYAAFVRKHPAAARILRGGHLRASPATATPARTHWWRDILPDIREALLVLSAALLALLALTPRSRLTATPELRSVVCGAAAVAVSLAVVSLP